MRAKTPFSPQNTLLRNLSIAAFDKLAEDPLASRLFGYALNWPTDTRALTDRLGNYAAVGTYKRKRRKPVVRAYIISPAVDALLDILVPALCARDPEPFRLFATATEAARPNADPTHPVPDTIPDHPVHKNISKGPRREFEPAHPLEYWALTLAYRIHLKSKDGVLPVTAATFRRRVEELWKHPGSNDSAAIDPAHFSRVCTRLGLKFRKDPKAGGRPPKGAGRF